MNSIVNCFRKSRGHFYIPYCRRWVPQKAVLLLIFLFTGAMVTKAQSVTLTVSNMPLDSVFVKIKAQTHYNFVYERSLISKGHTVSIRVRNASLQEVMTLCTRDQPFKYAIVEKTVVLIPRESAAANRNGSPSARQQIEGTVKNESGELLNGISVTVKGTNTGTQTNKAGQFMVDAQQGALLVFSGVGYISKEVATEAGQEPLDIILTATENKMEEVVVVGYGAQKRANLTGAVSSVKMDEVIGSRPVVSTAQALQGAIPGLQITYGTGQPGTSTNINVRGITSINGGGPLILMDNVPVNIDDINPTDIETVTVLKDAAASSIYGGRAAYGVILITTKKGRRNETISFNYNTNLSVTRASTLPEKPSPARYVQALKDFGTTQYWGGQDVAKWANYISDYEQNPSKYPKGYYKDPTSNGLIYPLAATDLSGALFPGGFEQMHNFSFSGGSERTNFRVATGYANENGIMIGDHDRYKRYNFNAMLNTALTSTLNASVNVLYNNTNKTSPVGQGTLYYNAITLPPMDATGYDTASTGEYLPYVTPANVALLEPPVNEFNDNLRLFGKMEFKPVKGLTITGEYTFQKTNNNTTQYTATNKYISPIKFDVSALNAASKFTKSNSQTNYSVLNLYAQYRRTLGDHDLSVLVGTNQEQSRQAGFNIGRTDVLSGQLPAISTSTGTIDGGDSYNEFGLSGYFARFNYSYKDRYLLEANGRYDGSSRFPSGSRYGFFPSFSAGWNVMNENFMRTAKNIINTLKIRGSWGEIGNQTIIKDGAQNYYPFMPGARPVNSGWLNPATGIPFVGIPAFTLVSSSFTWETVRTTNAGIDFGLLRNRLTGSFDIYQRLTLNMLAPSTPLPAVLGTDPPLANAANLKTKGWELELKWQDHKNDFQYSIGVNLYDSRATITKYRNPAGLLSSYYEGQTFGEIWGYQTMGYFTVDDFVPGTLDANLQNGTLKPGVAGFKGVKQNPGDIRYVDLNGDSAIFNGNNTLSNPGDRKVIGNNSRRLQFGINGSASYKGFDLSFFAIGVGKRDLWMGNQIIFPYQGQFGGIFANQMDYWTPDHTDAEYYRIYKDGAGNGGTNTQVQTKYLQSGAYLRLKNVTFGYSVPAHLTRKAFMKNIRVFFSGENLLTLDHLPEGLDAEATDISSGGIYPFIKKYSFGANITF